MSAEITTHFFYGIPLSNFEYNFSCHPSAALDTHLKSLFLKEAKALSDALDNKLDNTTKDTQNEFGLAIEMYNQVILDKYKFQPLVLSEGTDHYHRHWLAAYADWSADSSLVLSLVNQHAANFAAQHDLSMISVRLKEIARVIASATGSQPPTLYTEPDWYIVTNYG
jgi:hypothetical protein